MRWHFWAGIFALFAFILTGQYMDRTLDHLQGMADRPRMLYRSAHIYLFLSGVANLALGTFSKVERSKILAHLSLPVLLAPVLFLCAWWFEPKGPGFDRPFTRAALYSLLLSCVLWTWLTWKQKRKCHAEGESGYFPK